MNTRHTGSVDYAWDFYGCRGEVLQLARDALFETLLRDVKDAQFTLLDHAKYRFGPDGAISFLGLISESHVAIHGAPENGKLLEITIHTCVVEGTSDGPTPEEKKDALIAIWKKRFKPERIHEFEPRRRGVQSVPAMQEED